MKRAILLLSAGSAWSFALPGHAQDLQDRPLPPPPPSATAPAAVDAEGEQQVEFSATTLEYDSDADTVTAKGDVRMFRGQDRLRADEVTWNRKSGRVLATGNIAIVNPGGDTAYGDSIELTDTLKDGVVDNMLVVLNQGGRIAARRGTRTDEIVTLDDAAYTPCAVATSDGCPKEPSWQITAVKVVYDPHRGRISYSGARIRLLRILSIPLPKFSHPVGGKNDNGFLAPDIRYNGSNGLAVAVPYYFDLAPNRGLTITPFLFSKVLPMLRAEYQALDSNGAYRVTGYATQSRRTEDTLTGSTNGEQAFRGYLDAAGRFQFSPEWSVSGSIRLVTDRTFLRRYEVSNDDRLRSVVKAERIDADSYLSIAGWEIQTLRVVDRQGLQPVALPELDYRRRFRDVLGGRIEAEVNTLALTRSAGQDTQRAFASVRWDLRALTRWGQELTLTAYARGDLYHSTDRLATSVPMYRGFPGFQTRAIGALAADLKWPFVGAFLGGTQRITPRLQVVASPSIANINIPNEDARAVDLEDSNLFALNRFPGYDRFEDSTRFTYGFDYALDLPGLSVDTNIGQSYRLNSRRSLFPEGTGLTYRYSDFVGRTTVRFRDFVAFTWRYRLDRENLAFRRNEIDATIGSRQTYAMLGYLRLNRDIGAQLEDLRDREEARIAGRVAISRFWSVFGSAVVDLTDRAEDPLSLSDGFDPVRHRIGVEYEDDCLRLGLTVRRDYERTGDARGGNGFLLTLAFKNLGR